mmetsp:Transcript_53476/g.164434  ORF Transcript_53476/g.164434 Transcript_53476/m.164434 type:complete len:434 (+) Transcript_53476:895-2196(+)
MWSMRKPETMSSPAPRSVRSSDVPKSLIFTCPSERKRTFPGFMSRCTRPEVCKYSTPSSTCATKLADASSPSAPKFLTRSCNEPPPTYSITMKKTSTSASADPATGSGWSQNRYLITCGWSSARMSDTSFCSIAMRRSVSSSSDGNWSFFAAISSPVFEFMAAYTVEKPPRPRTVPRRYVGLLSRTVSRTSSLFRTERALLRNVCVVDSVCSDVRWLLVDARLPTVSWRRRPNSPTVIPAAVFVLSKLVPRCASPPNGSLVVVVAVPSALSSPNARVVFCGIIVLLPGDAVLSSCSCSSSSAVDPRMARTCAVASTKLWPTRTHASTSTDTRWPITTAFPSAATTKAPTTGAGSAMAARRCTSKTETADTRGGSMSSMSSTSKMRERVESLSDVERPSPEASNAAVAVDGRRLLALLDGTSSPSFAAASSFSK